MAVVDPNRRPNDSQRGNGVVGPPARQRLGLATAIWLSIPYSSVAAGATQSLMMNVFAGFGHGLAETITLSLGYRYFSTLDSGLGAGVNHGPFEFKTTFAAHSVDLGLRYTF